jgi:transcriptional regulator with XRE-family HTH domain
MAHSPFCLPAAVTDPDATPTLEARLAQRIAERIAELRQSQGLSQEAFGATVGASQATVSRWEDPQSSSTPSALELARLAERFAVSLAWLVGESEHRQTLPPRAALIDQAQLTAFAEAKTPERLEELLEHDLAFGTLWVQIPEGTEITSVEEALRRVREVDKHVRRLHPGIWEDWARLVLG